MTRLPLALRVLVLWLAVSLIGVTAPVWALVAFMWLMWRRFCERADAQLVVAYLGLADKE